MYLFKRTPSLTVRAECFSGINCTEKAHSDIRSATYMKNWRITDDGKLSKRNGYECVYNVKDSTPLFVGSLSGVECFVYKKGTYLYSVNLSDSELTAYDTGEDLGAEAFVFGGLLYTVGCESMVTFDGRSFSVPEPYIPTVALIAPNEGGGQTFEGINMISQYAKILYSPNGTSPEFILPESASGIYSVVDGNTKISDSDYIFENSSKKLTLNYIPASGVANSLEVTYIISAEYLPYPILHKKKFCLFGSSGDTRVFAYGNDGIIYYSDVTSRGADPTYFPAENFIRVGDGGEEVTSLCRHYSSLAVFTEKEAWYISPSSTDYDGYTKPTFPIFPLNSKVGCISEGAVLVNNSPLTVSEYGVYMWNSTSVRDEKNAKLISSPVEKLIGERFLENCKVFDSEPYGEVWIYSGDDILVYNYKRGAWYFFEGIRADRFFEYGATVYFVNSNGLYRFSDSVYTDNGSPYSAVWESAFSDFGTYEKKTLRRLYASFVPQINSDAVITVTPNVGKAEVLGTEGSFCSQRFSFGSIDFGNFSFECEDRPKTVCKRLNLRRTDSIKLRIENSQRDSRCTVDSITLRFRL